MSLNGLNKIQDIHQLLNNQYLQNNNLGIMMTSIYNQSINQGITTGNEYNLHKLDFRTSSTIVGSNHDINTNNIFHNISNLGGDIYDFDYTLTNNQLSITSSSDADQLGSSGIGTIVISGVDTNFNPITEVINLTGTIQKLSTDNFQMINTMSVLSVGSNKMAVGNIYINAANNSNKHALIPAGGSAILNGRTTIPAGYTGYLDNLIITGTKADEIEVGSFSVSKTFPLQQKSSILMYQNVFTSPALSFVTLPEKYTIVYGVKRLLNASMKVSISQRVKLIKNTEII